MPRSKAPAKPVAKKKPKTTGKLDTALDAIGDVVAKKSVKDNVKLMAAMDGLNAKHGKGAIIMANSSDLPTIDRISTGHFEIDLITGGGIPRGRIFEVSGWESSGKTTLVLQVIAQAQKAGLVAAYIDVEHSMDFEYAQLMGIDVDELLFSQPNSAEQALEIMEVLIKSGEVGLVVLDSVAGLAARRELEGDVSDEHIGEVARLLSKELKKINPVIGNTNTAVMLVNQLREKINSMGYGEKKTTTGGRALKFYASLRIEVTKIETLTATIKGDKIAIGQRNELKTIKNKVGPAMRKLKVDLRYPTDLGDGKIQTPGYDHIAPLIQAAVDAGMTGGGQKNYVFPDGKSIKGAENAREYVLANPEIEKQLMEMVSSKPI